MHGSDEPAYPADVRHVRARPGEQRARCLRAPASSLCVGCRCDMSSAVRCVSMRLLLCPSAATVSARLLAGAARQRDGSRGAQSAE